VLRGRKIRQAWAVARFEGIDDMPQMAGEISISNRSSRLDDV